LTILGNVLDFRTYSAPNQDEEEGASHDQKLLMAKFDRNHIPGNERMAISYARGIALYVFDWVRSQCVVTGPDGNTVDDLPSRLLIQVIKALLNYKRKAMQMKFRGAPHCNTGSLQKQVMNLVKSDKLVENMWRDSEDICDNSLVLQHKDGYSVKWKDPPASQSDVLDLGKSFSASI